ncbi:MAG: response regulator transcription factor [Chloroflexales bacterium]|nr:response regulator transcription factor [Chloroflexales bacterium]
METQRPIGVVLVDDHAMTRIGLAFMLKTFPDITLLGEAATGAEALEVCATTAPNVVLMDMHLPDQEGSAVTAALLRRQPGVKVVVLSSFDDRALVERALQAGAISYVLKHASAIELAQAIRRAHDGKATLSPEAAQVLVERMHQIAAPQLVFTERERAVLQLLAQGQSNAQIAAQLHVSAATVKGHVGAILGKLGVATRSEAIAKAWSEGLVKRDEPQA